MLRPLLHGAGDRGPARRSLRWDQDWRFGGKFTPGAASPGFDDSAFETVTLPHCVARLSWQDWKAESWQAVWVYRKHFTVPPEWTGWRVFVEFAGVMVGTTPTINGHELPQHLGTYLPARYELTSWLKPGSDNVLAVAVDSRWLPVPPDGSAKGVARVDYLEAGGIYRSVRLEAVPPAYIREVFAKPLDVLKPNRRIEVSGAIDGVGSAHGRCEALIELKDRGQVVASARQAVVPGAEGSASFAVTLTGLGGLALWDVDSPQLYEVVSTLLVDGQPLHDHVVRTGLREARFTTEGFFLNGRRLQLFGLNRHEIYPYVGGAMPPRVMRRDALILKRDFNCNIVRCSHYPQSEAFLEACDELGLMVWEEPPGWGYLGDEAWKELVIRDVREMVLRDRNHPAIVIWGVRVNESPNDPVLYRKTGAVAKALDGTRPTSGSMTGGSIQHWQEDRHEDVFAMDDYHADGPGVVGIHPPLPGIPYLLAESVGQFNYGAGKGFDAFYRRAGDLRLLEQQGLRHAQAHSKAGQFPGICGVIAWCAFDYASLINAHRGVKTPGVADCFRIPKLGAAFYRAQTDPKVRPVIAPSFLWDFGPHSPRGPGKRAAIFSNCTSLEVFVAGQLHAKLEPDAAGFPHLKHPPFFADLDVEGANLPELRIDGFRDGAKVLSRRFSAERSTDRFIVAADDLELTGDGADATRVVMRVADQFGADRAFGGGSVSFAIEGPGTLVGDNPFLLADAGGVGAIWVKSRPNSSGEIVLTAHHSQLGSQTVRIAVRPESRELM
jgi:beta-galactosidase